MTMQIHQNQKITRIPADQFRVLILHESLLWPLPLADL